MLFHRSEKIFDNLPFIMAHKSLGTKELAFKLVTGGIKVNPYLFNMTHDYYYDGEIFDSIIRQVSRSTGIPESTVMTIMVFRFGATINYLRRLYEHSINLVKFILDHILPSRISIAKEFMEESCKLRTPVAIVDKWVKKTMFELRELKLTPDASSLLEDLDEFHNDRYSSGYVLWYKSKFRCVLQRFYPCNQYAISDPKLNMNDPQEEIFIELEDDENSAEAARCLKKVEKVGTSMQLNEIYFTCGFCASKFLNRDEFVACEDNCIRLKINNSEE